MKSSDNDWQKFLLHRQKFYEIAQKHPEHANNLLNIVYPTKYLSLIEEERKSLGLPLRFPVIPNTEWDSDNEIDEDSSSVKSNHESSNTKYQSLIINQTADSHHR